MSKVSKFLLLIFLVLLLLAVAATYYRFVTLKDYETFYDDYGESETLLE